MTPTVLALVPATTAVLYFALARVVLRRTTGDQGTREFLAYLGLLGAGSVFSAIWRVTQDLSTAEYLLRFLELCLVMTPFSFLYFLQAFYPTRWSRRARRLTYALVVCAVVPTMSGALNRVTVDPVPTPEVWESALFYLMITGQVVGWIAGVTYVSAAYRLQRDPFERNRLKYVAVATTLIIAGGNTNLIEALRVLPVDQGINGAAAALLAFSIARYRLFNIDLAVRGGLIQAVVTAVVTGAYVGSLTVVYRAFGIDLGTQEGVVVALFMGVPIGVLAAGVRHGTLWLFDRVFVGGRIDRDEVLAEFQRRTAELRSVDGLVREFTELCQRAAQSSFVATLLPNDRNELSLGHVSGPLPRPKPEWTIRLENSLLSLVAEPREPMTPYSFDRLLRSADVAPHDLAEFGPYRDCIMVPLWAHDDLIGIVFISAKVYDSAYTLNELDLFSVVSGQAALAIENARLFEQLQEQAQTDFLTRLPNHRHLQDVFEETLAQAKASGSPFTVAMVDLDNFKLLNDVHGHQVGDDALQRIAAVMRAAIGPDDVVGRYGGDEFLLILPGRNKEQGSELMARVARAVKRTPLAASDSEISASERLPARISWGVAAYPENGVTRRALISVADSELLQNKFEMRRSGTIHTHRPTTGTLLEQDPEKLRIARSLLDIIDAKDPYTSEHSQQLASFALLVADELGLPDRERYAIWLGALLHDVGKIGTPAEILRKPGRLTPDEWIQMRQHPSLGETMMRGLLDIEEVIEIVGCHHERWDGNGYPRGLAGDEIPRLARLMSVADAFSAMVHDRPYRKGLSWPEATAELRRSAGTQFDPDAVEVFARAIGQAEASSQAAA